MSEKTPGVLDPHWEDALRAGQEADAGRGSVDAELAVVHLFRHAAGPEALEADAVDAVWSEVSAQIEAESGFVPWWRRMLDWRVGVGLAVGVAAAAVLVIASRPNPAPQPDPGAVAQLDGASAGMSDTLSAQFEMLAPTARRAIDVEVDDGRSAVRRQMLAGLSTPSATPDGRANPMPNPGGAQ